MAKSPDPAAAAVAADLRLAAVQAKLDSAQSKLKDSQSVVASMEKLVEQQNERIERIGQTKFSIPVSRPSRPRGSFTRLIVPDTHGSKISPSASSALLSDAEALAPKQVILLGDHTDCGGFLAQHHTLGYVADLDYTVEQDIVAGNTFFDRLQAACPPSAEYHFVEGNHEHRLEQWCTTTALRQTSAGDAQWIARQLMSLFCVQAVLHLEARGIRFYSRNVRHSEDVKGPGVVKIGRCLFVHGHRHGIHVASQMLSDYSFNVVFGHNHRRQSHFKWSADGEIGAWCPGCLCELRPCWQHSVPTHWTHGYAVQLVRADGSFLHINVPIIEGKSYLTQLTASLS